MRTNNGYLAIERDGEQTILIATELTNDIPSGSRSATLIVSPSCLDDVIRELTAIRNGHNRAPATYHDVPGKPGAIHTAPFSECPLCNPKPTCEACIQGGATVLRPHTCCQTSIKELIGAH